MTGLIKNAKKENAKKQKTRSLIRTEALQFENTTGVHDLQAVIREVKTEQKPAKKERYNIKLYANTMANLNAIKTMKHQKFYYEVIDTALDYYVSQKFSDDEKKLYKILYEQYKNDF